MQSWYRPRSKGLAGSTSPIGVMSARADGTEARRRHTRTKPGQQEIERSPIVLLKKGSSLPPLKRVPVGWSQGHEGNRHAHLAPDPTKAALDVNYLPPDRCTPEAAHDRRLLSGIRMWRSACLPLLRCRLNLPFATPSRLLAVLLDFPGRETGRLRDHHFGFKSLESSRRCGSQHRAVAVGGAKTKVQRAQTQNHDRFLGSGNVASGPFRRRRTWASRGSTSRRSSACSE